MEPQQPYSRSWAIRIPILVLAFFTLVLAGLNIRALTYTDESCDVPLREWMAIALILLFLAAIPWIIIELCLSSCLAGEGTTSCYKAYYIVLGSVLGVWCGIGLWLLTTDDTCAHDFYQGYDISMITTGAYFILLSILMPLYFMSKSCGWFEPKKKGYEPIE